MASTKPLRVLLVYGYEPSGHSAAAFALEEALSARGALVSRVEVSSGHHSLAARVVARGYHWLVRRAPVVIGALYRSTAASDALRGVRGAYLALGGARKLLAGVRRQRAEAVVCPQASVCAVFSEARRRGELDVPVIGVLTDYAAHPFWTDPAPDLLLAPDAETAGRLGAEVSGIPVRAACSRLPERAQARAALALPASAPVVLLSGGSKGLGGLESAAAALLEAAPRVHALALCGSDDRLRVSLSRRAGERLRVFGPQPAALVAAMMAAADLHLCKPGGVTVAESLAAGLPLVLLPPLPGQEEENASWLERRGAALRVQSPVAAGRLAAVLLDDAPRLRALADAARAAGAPDAASRAAELILGVPVRSP